MGASLGVERLINIGDGDVVGCWRARIEGVWIGDTEHFDFVAATDQGAPVLGRANPFGVNDEVWCQAYPGLALPGGLAEGVVYHVVEVAGDGVKLSATAGGAAIGITSDGRAVLSKALAVYRQSDGTDILLAIRVEGATAWTAAQKNEARETLRRMCLRFEAENQGVAL